MDRSAIATPSIQDLLPISTWERPATNCFGRRPRSTHFLLLSHCGTRARPERWPGMIGSMGDIILLRHGQTEWSAAGRHTGRTDIPLTQKGMTDAAALAPMLARRLAGTRLAAVFTSPAQRAVRTAELAGFGRPGAPG